MSWELLVGTFWGCLACLGVWAAPGAVPEAFLRESGPVLGGAGGPVSACGAL